MIMKEAFFYGNRSQEKIIEKIQKQAEKKDIMLNQNYDNNDNIL